MFNQPTQSEIRTAKRQAVGGARKRCRKGKNCSAACIAADMACLVEMPESAGIATTKVRDMLQQRATPKAREYFRKKGIVRGNYGGGTPVSSLVDKKAPLSPTDLDLMEKSWKRYEKTGELEFPFKMPKKYDNNSGTPEAVNEIVSLRNQLQQDKKTGRITIPEGVKISKLARELVNEWNSLDLSTVYVNSAQGNRLNVSGLGVTAGPRNSVPKDAVRGLVQYVALRRQQAELEDTPNGKRITSYRDPFTGQRRPYMVGDAVVASQDHWQKPFGIYGILSENDVKNTAFMPASMNSNKGEASPARYLHSTLVKNGRLQDTSSPNRDALGGFEHRYDKDGAKDFLPKGLTRESEKAALRDTSIGMVKLATDTIAEKHVPRIEKALQGEPTMAQAAKLIHGIVKQESTRNYYGGFLRFADGQRILTPYEQNLAKGLNLAKTDAVVVKGIQDNMAATGKTPKQILQEILQNRQGYAPKSTGSGEAVTSAPKPAKAPSESKKAQESAPSPTKSKPYEVAVTQGRFNIPHLGHVKMIQEMLEQADTAHVLIGKGKDNIDQDLRSQLLRAALRHEGVDLSRVKLIKQENMMQYAPALSSKVGDKKAIAVLGEDQEKFLQSVGKVAKMDTHLVPRGAGGASSTKIREMIDSGDLAGLRKAYEYDPYLVRLARAARSVEKEPEKWGVQKEAKAPAKPKGTKKEGEAPKTTAPRKIETKPKAKEEETPKTPPPRKIETKPRTDGEKPQSTTPPPRKIETKPRAKKEEEPKGAAPSAAKTVSAPATTPAAAQKAPTLEELSKRVTEAGKEWARLNGTPGGSAARANFEKAKADLQNAKTAQAAAKTSQTSAKAASTLESLKQYSPQNYQSSRGLTQSQDEVVNKAAYDTNQRIDRKLNERQFYDDKTNARIKAANQAIVAPFQKMNEDEKGALALYGQQGVKHFESVNQLLRSGKIENSSPDKVKMAEFISSNLKSGLEKLPPAKVEELGRAVSGNFATSLASLKPGDVLEDKGFGSYTNKGNPVYDQFFSKTGPNASIRILNPKGAREIAPVMEYSQEGEHITLPGTRLRLVKVDEKGVYSRKTGGYIPQYTFEEIEG